MRKFNKADDKFYKADDKFNKADDKFNKADDKFNKATTPKTAQPAKGMDSEAAVNDTTLTTGDIYSHPVQSSNNRNRCM